MAAVAPITPPIAIDLDGVMRVGGTRVTLETIVESFEDGAGPEEIVAQYPSLSLSEVYAAITFYLQHRPEVEEYLARRRSEAGAREREGRAQPHMQDLRARLLARRQG